MASNLGARRDGIAGAKVRKMRDAAKRTLGWALAVAAVATVVILASGEKDEPAPAPVPSADETVETVDEPAPGSADGSGTEADGGEQDEDGDANEGEAAEPGDGPSQAEIARERLGRAAERTYRAYVAAINARDGAALCRLLAPGFLAELDPEVSRGDCAATMHAAIGYEDPRRFPVWEKTILSGFEQIAADPDAAEARVTAAVITRFADRTEPSVESDIAYLGRTAGSERLVLLKASGILWRAVGKPDYPPSVITPP
jgi:hypothetical protein